MKTLFLHSCLIGLLGSMQYACTNSNQQEQQNTTSTSIATPATPEPSTTTSVTTSQPKAMPSDSSGQNYMFSGTGGELQIKGKENQYDILLPADILFDFDKSTLRPEGTALLQKVNQHFATHGVDQLHVWGHTDSKGDNQYNFKLSQRRAIAVAEWLKKNIKTKGLVMAVGRGEQEPLVPNENPDGTDNPENRQQNRRVTLSVVKYPDVNKMMNQPKN